MKALIIVPVVILLAVAVFGQQTAQSATSQAPAIDTPGKTAASPTVGGGVEVLSDTEGVDFGPYLAKLVEAVRKNWHNLVPEAARPPRLEHGKVSIEFAILPDGKVTAMRIVKQSGDVALDRAAWGGITASIPFAPLPNQFTGPHLALRFNFFYNPDKGEVPSDQKKPTSPYQ